MSKSTLQISLILALLLSLLAPARAATDYGLRQMDSGASVSYNLRLEK
jgi:hypothetical protein